MTSPYPSSGPPTGPPSYVVTTGSSGPAPTPVYVNVSQVHGQQQQPYMSQQATFVNPTGIVQNNNINPVVPFGIPPSQYGRWVDGLFDCGNQLLPSCLCAAFCPCIITAQVSEKLQWLSCCYVASAYITLCIVLFIIGIIIQSFQVYIICWIFMAVLSFQLRGKIRQVLAIPGSDGEDCLIACCCTCCNIAQLARQVFAYREPCESCSCDADGTPIWQRQAPNNGNVLAYPPNIQMQQFRPQFVQQQPIVVQTYTSYPQTTAQVEQPPPIAKADYV